MLAIAVSSDAIASAVKMATAAHLRRSAGRPSITTGPLAETISVDIRKALRLSGCGAEPDRPAVDALHAAYAIEARRAACPRRAGGIVSARAPGSCVMFRQIFP